MTSTDSSAPVNNPVNGNEEEERKSGEDEQATIPIPEKFGGDDKDPKKVGENDKELPASITVGIEQSTEDSLINLVKDTNDNANLSNATEVCSEDKLGLGQKIPPPKESNDTESVLTTSGTTAMEESSEEDLDSDTAKCNGHCERRINRASSEDEIDMVGKVSGSGPQQSYPEMKLKRKNLIKIVKLTDSDSRSRAKMRRRALSPPSSSDEENLHIGWIAYPSSLSSFRKSKRPVWVKAAKLICLPIAKVCKKCISNSKVAANLETSLSAT